MLQEIWLDLRKRWSLSAGRHALL